MFNASAGVWEGCIKEEFIRFRIPYLQGRQIVRPDNVDKLGCFCDHVIDVVLLTVVVILKARKQWLLAVKYRKILDLENGCQLLRIKSMTGGQKQDRSGRRR